MDVNSSIFALVCVGWRVKLFFFRILGNFRKIRGGILKKIDGFKAKNTLNLSRPDLCVKSKTRKILIFRTLLEVKVVFSTVLGEKSSKSQQTLLSLLGFLVNLHGSNMTSVLTGRRRKQMSAFSNWRRDRISQKYLEIIYLKNKQQRTIIV